MALEIHILGPGLEARRLVHAGDPELILGRDIACDVNLPDPERNVSRRHLAVWNVADQLQFRVLSSVNGIDMPFGYAPPGTQGVLPTGQMLKVGDYSVQVLVPAAKDVEQDPWAVFDNDPAGSDATLPRPASMTAAPAADFGAQVITPEEDPFGDWGFESTFGPGGEGAGPKSGPQPLAAGGGDLSAFYKGLGLDKANLGPLSPTDLEAAGRAVRTALEGLFHLYASRAGGPERRPPGAHGVVPVKDNNPLKTDWPDDTKLQYLLGGRAASIGFLSPQRALTDIVGEMMAHDAAMASAVRAAVEATVQEFAPAALKERLLGSGSKLFEGTRAWDAYSRHYGDMSQDLAQWVQQLLDQHFKEAYLRESQRIKRETGLAPD
ncbi:type VI secretion system-associated FHA domain protein [Caenimonas terrae]|uniref:Type VI secretion system-associated FHA domain protein n=1 Tax=Caenimonas terrae TaxID=696074 RepID=A0ABW0NKK5_9BURK